MEDKATASSKLEPSIAHQLPQTTIGPKKQNGMMYRSRAFGLNQTIAKTAAIQGVDIIAPANVPKNAPAPKPPEVPIVT